MQVNTLRGIAGRSLGYDDEDHLLSTGTAACGYDLDGFLTAKTEGAEITAYDYSLRGELLRVDLPGGRTIEYTYDPLGRRIAKKIGGTVTEKYLWRGLTRLLAVYDASDNLVMRFEYADGRMPVSMTKAGTVYYLSYDPVGSLRLVADASGSVVKKIEYDSFGNILSDTAPSFGLPFGFAGGLYDGDTGLVRFGYRDYDPDVGRWTAKDPILFGGGDSDLYGYCLGDPVNWVDLDGLFSSQNFSFAFFDLKEAQKDAEKINGHVCAANENLRFYIKTGDPQYYDKYADHRVKGAKAHKDTLQHGADAAGNIMWGIYQPGIKLE